MWDTEKKETVMKRKKKGTTVAAQCDSKVRIRPRVRGGTDLINLGPGKRREGVQTSRKRAIEYCYKGIEGGAKRVEL